MTPPFPLAAALGGPPLRPEGPPPWPPPDDAVRAALQACYADGSWGRYHGGRVEELERRLCALHGIDFAVTCASGTFAVEAALRALRVGPGDEVVLAAYDYPGNFLAVHALGAVPVLADVAPANWNLCVEQAAAALGPKTRAVVASHLHGGLVPMRRLTELAAAHGVPVVEDAAQCPGALVEGRPAGTWGDAGVLSFGGSKLLTAGRGGAVLTRHADVHQRLRVALLRGNLVCPLSELQAAVLLPQLERLDERNSRRAASVERLREALADVPTLRPFANDLPDSRPGYYKVGFDYDEAAAGLPRKRFVAAVRAEGVALDEGFRALHAGRSKSRYRAGTDLAEAGRADRGCVILHHPVLLGSEVDVAQAGEAIRKVLAQAGAIAGVTGEG